MRQDLEEVRLLRGLTFLEGLTQREVSRRLGVTEALVSMWAHGRRKAGAARMAALRQLVADMRSDEERRSDERRNQLVEIYRTALKT